MLSTLHTNDAPSSINRLVNMGIEPFLVANSVNLVCGAAPRAPGLRAAARSRTTIPSTRLARGRASRKTSWRRRQAACKGRGCDRCGGTGYKGRVGLFEVMEITESLRELIIANAPVDRTAASGRSHEGMSTLRQSGLQKVRDGVDDVRRSRAGNDVRRTRHGEHR